MSDKRLDRELENRNTRKRTQHWTRPETLPSPNPVDGYTFHWVRVATMGQADPTNVSSKLREGWTPCKAADHPEIMLVSIENERFAENVVMGGLMLCKAPVELVEERNDYYGQLANSQMTSVDNNLMRESDPRMPIFNDRKTKVTFGSGN